MRFDFYLLIRLLLGPEFSLFYILHGWIADSQNGSILLKGLDIIIFSPPSTVNVVFLNTTNHRSIQRTRSADFRARNLASSRWLLIVIAGRRPSRNHINDDLTLIIGILEWIVENVDCVLEILNSARSLCIISFDDALLAGNFLHDSGICQSLKDQQVLLRFQVTLHGFGWLSHLVFVCLQKLFLDLVVILFSSQAILEVFHLLFDLAVTKFLLNIL